MGNQHVRGGSLRLTQHKNRKRNPVTLDMPILPMLEKIIAASPCGEMTFLVTEFGQPFSSAGFGNWFRDRCKDAKVPGRAHGLRKAGATIAAENLATPHQLNSIFGWRALKEAERYTKAAQQKLLAGGAAALIQIPGWK